MLRQEISSAHFIRAKQRNTEEAYQHFINQNVWAKEVETAVLLRDSSAFYSALNNKNSISMHNFMEKYPNSSFSEQAQDLFFKWQYEENTDPKNNASFVAFKANFPNNPYGANAEFQLYNFAKEKNTISGYQTFIKNNPNSIYTNEAWRFIYRIHVTENGMANLSAFKKTYPNYPFQNEIDQEIKLLQTQLFPFVQNKLWGFMDQNGKKIIAPQFSFVDFFSQGRAQVLKNDKYGFIDVFGNEVIPPQFRDAYDFKYNMCVVVTTEEKTGLMDLFGAWVVPPNYNDIIIINPNKVWVQANDGYQLLDVNTKKAHQTIFTEITEFQNNYCLVFEQEKKFIIDSKGNTLFSTDHSIEQFGDFFILDAEDSVAVIDGTGKIILPYSDYEFGNYNAKGLTAFLVNDKIGYLNADMEIIIAPKFDVFPNWRMFANFNNSYAKAYNAKTKKYGLINESGQWIIQAKYNDISFLSEKIAVLNKKWEYIDKNEKKLNLGSFDLAESFVNETALVYDAVNNAWNILSEEGKVLLGSNVQRINRFDENLIRWQDTQGNLWLGNARGELIFDAPCNRIDKTEDNIVRLLSNDILYYYLIREKKLINLKQ
jgi:hypothetical protein